MINVLTGLSEAISNVTNHAYPAEYQPDYMSGASGFRQPQIGTTIP